MFAGFIGLCAIVYAAVRVPLPNDIALPQQTQLSYADGSPMSTIGSVNRTSVPLSDVPVPVRQAVLAAEDRNFYHEPGISITGIGRAIVADVTGGGIKQGGSTITQQYAKNTYLGQQRTFTRKAKEIVLAIKISRKYSKDQVLEYYLNTIYFGRGAYGIQAASQAYFGVPVNHLDAAQGAVLAGLIRAPSVLDPAVNPNSAKARWTQVVDQMAKDKALTPEQRAALVYPSTVPKSNTASQTSGPKSYINAAIKDFLDGKLGEARVALGGLTVTTTIDVTSQKAAEDAIKAQTAGAPATLRPALVSVDPTTGAIRAYYGGGTAGMADAANYLNPPAGSAFKPITLAAALSNGAKLSDSFSGSSPQTFGTDIVRNFNNEQFGQINLVTATAESVNTVYLQLANKAGPAKVVDLAHKMGIPDTVRLDAVPEIALGTTGVTPLSMAQVYTAFANQGNAVTPYLVQKVTDRSGKVLYEAKPALRQVFSADVAKDATTAMQAVLQYGTAAGSGLAGGRPAAGKTGTIDGNKAAWFVGYTPQVVTVVSYAQWQNGSVVPLTPYKQCGCGEVTGGTLPAKTWKQFMDAALAGQPVLQFPGTVVNVAPTPSDTPTPTPTASALPKPSATVSSGATASSSATGTATATASPTISVPPSSSPPPSVPAAQLHATAATGPD